MKRGKRKKELESKTWDFLPAKNDRTPKRENS